MAAPSRHMVKPALLLLAGVCAACGGGGADGEATADAPGADVAAVADLATERPTIPVRRVDRATRSAPDSALEEPTAFPHHEHRGIDCQTCHRRPATHVTHQAAACTACHGRIGDSAATVSAASGRCASCHHGRSQRAACATCHDTGGIGERPVRVEVSAAGRTGASRARPLPFDHGTHAALECARCHTDPVTRAFGVECGTCHASHHRATSECTTCHDARGVAAHDNAVHAGCGGAGCHSDSAVLALPLTRTVCLVCHSDQENHRPDEDCSSCHIAARGGPDRIGKEGG